MEPIEITVVLRCNPARAFAAFTCKIADWWPVESHSVSAGLHKTRPESIVFDPYEGGQIYEIAPDGTRHVWGHVTDWDAPHRIGFDWHVGQADKTHSTQVMVTFTPTDAGQTVVNLRHTGWEILGDAAPTKHENYVKGWTVILCERFANYLNGEANEQT